MMMAIRTKLSEQDHKWCPFNSASSRKLIPLYLDIPGRKSVLPAEWHRRTKTKQDIIRSRRLMSPVNMLSLLGKSTSFGERQKVTACPRGEKQWISIAEPAERRS